MLPAADADLVVAATSFHWVEPEIGAPKALSVLRPGGSIAIWWNLFYDPRGPDEFSRALDPIFEEFGDVESPAFVDTRAGGVLDPGFAGGRLRRGASPSAFRGRSSRPREDIVALFSTFSNMRLRPDARAGAGARPNRRRGRRPVRRSRATHVPGRALHRAQGRRLSSAGLADAEHCLDDAVVAGAAAEVPGEPDPHLVLGR